MAPVESAILPEGLNRVAGDAPALAQDPPQAIVPGEPQACPQDPVPWTEAGAECVLQQDACPESPVNDGVFLTPSFGHPDSADLHGQVIHRYTGFCEERILERVNADGYARCTTETGFIVMIHEMEEITDNNGDPVTMHMCRLIHTSLCVSPMHRVGSNTCRAIKRRTWRCPPDSIPRNEFNSCYKELPTIAVPHPACGPGAPDIVAQKCKDYVGNDYAPNPTTVDCAGFDTGNSPAMSAITPPQASSAYWCEFNGVLLNPACHGANPPLPDCAETPALCLKRGSESGGCSGIARAIGCRALQVQGLPTVDVRAQGCEPCIILPFRRIPRRCSADLRRRPTRPLQGLQGKYDTLHRVEASIAIDSVACGAVRLGGDLDAACRDVPVCTGAPRGHLTWTSSHQSGLAIVNLPVVLEIVEMPRDFRETPLTFFDGENNIITSGVHNYVTFDDDQHGDPLVRLWHAMDPAATYGRLTDYLRLDDLLSAPPGTCLLQELPDLRATVEELWPDDPGQKAEILELFGPQSLDWWENLTPAAQQRHTDSRGPALVEEIACNTEAGERAWCRWLPTRSGYFKVTGAGAWLVKLFNSPTRWFRRSESQAHLDALVAFLDDPNNTVRVEEMLDKVNLQAEEAGLESSLTALLAHAPGTFFDEWLYTVEADAQHRCPQTDLRVNCGGTDLVGNYTETEPVGIVVHEMRVATRVPNK